MLLWLWFACRRRRRRRRRRCRRYCCCFCIVNSTKRRTNRSRLTTHSLTRPRPHSSHTLVLVLPHSTHAYNSSYRILSHPSLDHRLFLILFANPPTPTPTRTPTSPLVTAPCAPSRPHYALCTPLPLARSLTHCTPPPGSLPHPAMRYVNRRAPRAPFYISPSPIACQFVPPPPQHTLSPYTPRMVSSRPTPPPGPLPHSPPGPHPHSPPGPHPHSKSCSMASSSSASSNASPALI